MIPLSRLRSFLVAGLCVGSVPAVNADDEWALISSLQFNEARGAFSAADQDEPSNRFGLGVALLGSQPKTEANLARAETIFRELRDAAPTGDIGVRAGFFLGRVAHLHRQPSRWSEAAERYRATYDAAPAHPIAQRALVHWGIVVLLRANKAEDVREELERFNAEIAKFTDEGSARDAHWVLMEFYERKLNDQAATLREVEAVLASAVPLRDVTRFGLLIQAAELSRLLGDTEKALKYFRAFVAHATRDSRIFLVKERIAELEASQ